MATLIDAVSENLRGRIREAHLEERACDDEGDVVGVRQARQRRRRLERLYVSVVLGWDLPPAALKLP
jgi:hypothetical protein